jgi:serine protease Do
MRTTGFLGNAWGACGHCVLAVLLASAPLAAQQAGVSFMPAIWFDDDQFAFRMVGTPGSFLGVGVADIDTERSKALKLKEERGVEVTRVEQDSPAEKAGLKVGDAVLEYNGQHVEGTEQFVRLVRETPAGRTAKLLIVRNGTQQTITATIGARKAMTMPGVAEQFRVIPRIEIPDVQIPDMPKPNMSWRSVRLGIDAESVDSQLAEFFGVKEGVLVRSVMSDSAAAKAGIRAGDVIVKIEDSKVTSPREITSVLRGLTDHKSVPVTLVREKREMTVNVTMDEMQQNQMERPRSRSVGDQIKL